MVLIVAACLLGLISNLSTIISNISTQTHDLFRLYTVGTESIQTPLNFSLCYIWAIC